MAFADRYPRWVRGVVLISSCAKLFSSTGPLEAFFHALPGAMRRIPFLWAAKRILFGSSVSTLTARWALDDLLGTPADTIRQDMIVAKAMDLDDAARRLHVPALILCGTEDVVTPLPMSRRLHELIPRSRLEVVEGAGHMLPLEAPDRVNREIATFVQTVERTATRAPFGRSKQGLHALVRNLIRVTRAFASQFRTQMNVAHASPSTSAHTR